MDLETRYAVADQSLEEGGAWVELESGAQVKVARSGNKKHRKAGARLLAPYKRYARMNAVPDDVEKKLEAAIVEALAEGVLLDWKGLKVNGVDLPYSKENAIMVLTKYKGFREDIEYLANEAETFRQQDIEAAAKNS